MAIRVLLMDDEPAICEITELLLKKLGYDPIVTQSGNGAIDAFRTAVDEQRPFDVVILDLTIPGGMGGREVIKVIREIKSDIRALVSSGDLMDPAVVSFRDFGFSGVLAKPYNKVALDAAIRQVLKE